MTACLAITILLAFAAPPYDSAMHAANQAYESQQYDEAVRQYESIAAEGVEDATLFYNLGNAFFRTGQAAPAIASYERALQLNPRMEMARHNLEHAVASTAGHLARPLGPPWQEALLFWDDRLQVGEVRLLAIASWTGFWAMLLWRVAARRRYQLLLAALFLAVAGASMASLFAKSYPLQLAVANAPELPVRIGANPADTVRYSLAPGDRVLVEAERGGWLRVATASGERGWAPAEDFLLVGPPYGPLSAAPAEAAP